VDVGDRSTPTFVDINNDGDFDAFIGERYGAIKYYENTGTATSPTFTEHTGGDNPLNVDVGYYSTPTFVDIYDDGDFDAFIGEGYGTINYYENIPSITVTKENDYGGGSVAPGTNNVRFLRLGVQTDSGTATITSVKTKFTATSSAVNSDISAFDVYYDANGNGELDDGAPLQTVSNPDLTNGATASGLSFSVDATKKYLLLVLDIAGGANPSHNAGMELTSNTFITSSDAGVASTNFPIKNSMDNSLPVQLASFSAASTSEGVTLNWRTETEVNNVGFSVYRSNTREGDYTKIGFVEGHGSTPVANDYYFNDKTAEAGRTYFYLIESIDVEGNKERSDSISITFTPQPKVALPTRFALRQNFPNPFNPETWIPFQLPKDSDVVVEIYNLNGQIVRTLSLGKVPAGYYNERRNAAFWDGKSDSGEKVSSGVYFYRLKAGDYSAVKRMVVVK
jgi:hypothetical protein